MFLTVFKYFNTIKLLKSKSKLIYLQYIPYFFYYVFIYIIKLQLTYKAEIKKLKKGNKYF